MNRFVAAGAIALAISAASMQPNPALGGYIHDDFNQGGPGADHWLTGWSGDTEGFDGPWNGDDRALRYLGNYSLAIQQPGYSNYGNDPGEGRVIPGTGLGFRSFPATIRGTIWFSALVEYFANSAYPQDVVIGGRFNDPRSFFGMEGGFGFPARSFVEFWVPGAVPAVKQGTIWGDLIGPGHPCSYCAFPAPAGRESAV